MQNIKVIGIDPAPSKKNTIFDGKEFYQKDCNELKKYLEEIKFEKGNVLICWDAPLSFDEESGKFYIRKIESFFARQKLPKGISVLGYARCPHWAISQYLLGYPKISNFEKDFNPPFELIFDKENIRKSVTEVHPAVAIWLLLKDKKEWKNEKWEYKKDNTILEKVKNTLTIGDEIKSNIKTDDYLDAYIAWKLGRDWIDGKGDILGDNSTGSFLLPYNDFTIEEIKTQK